MAVHNRAQSRRAAKGGAIAGLVAGLFTSVFLAIMNAAQGRDVLQGLKFAGVPVLGKRALEPGFDHVAIVIGVFDHLVISMAWGFFFGLLFFGLSKGMTMLAGVFWGLVVWIVMLYVALPVLGFPPGGNNPLPVAIFTHVLFAEVLAAAFLPFQREIHAIPRHRPTTLP